VTPHHRFLLREHLAIVDHLRERIAVFDAQIGAGLEPFRVAAGRLVSIPGVSDVTAQVIVAEIGIDMSRFPTVRHLISWAGLCPRMDESAGKRRSTRIRKGAPWLKTVLVQCAWAATRAKGTYLQAQFRRLKGRRGAMKAIVAVAASILTAAYHMLRDGVTYRELGSAYFDRRDKTKLAQRLARRIKDLGYEVHLNVAAA
jgi:transposase